MQLVFLERQLMSFQVQHVLVLLGLLVFYYVLQCSHADTSFLDSWEIPRGFLSGSLHIYCVHISNKLGFSVWQNHSRLDNESGEEGLLCGNEK